MLWDPVQKQWYDSSLRETLLLILESCPERQEASVCVCVCVCLCVFLDWENQYCENVYTITILFYTIQSNLQTQCNFYQLTNGMSHRIRTNFTICMGTQMTLDSQNNIANKMNNIDEVDRFSERYNLPTVNQEKIKYMNIPITSSIVSPLGNLTWSPP